MKVSFCYFFNATWKFEEFFEKILLLFWWQFAIQKLDWRNHKWWQKYKGLVFISILLNTIQKKYGRDDKPHNLWRFDEDISFQTSIHLWIMYETCQKVTQIGHVNIPKLCIYYTHNLWKLNEYTVLQTWIVVNYV